MYVVTGLVLATFVSLSGTSASVDTANAQTAPTPIVSVSGSAGILG